MKPFIAWAVIDKTGVALLGTEDLCSTRAKANRIKMIRKNVKFPLYEKAVWQVVRVEVRKK
jgi:hypothetical protein